MPAHVSLRESSDTLQLIFHCWIVSSKPLDVDQSNNQDLLLFGGNAFHPLDHLNCFRNKELALINFVLTSHFTTSTESLPKFTSPNPWLQCLILLPCLCLKTTFVFIQVNIIYTVLFSSHFVVLQIQRQRILHGSIFRSCCCCCSECCLNLLVLFYYWLRTYW